MTDGMTLFLIISTTSEDPDEERDFPPPTWWGEGRKWDLNELSCDKKGRTGTSHEECKWIRTKPQPRVRRRSHRQREGCNFALISVKTHKPMRNWATLLSSTTFIKNSTLNRFVNACHHRFIYHQDPSRPACSAQWPGPVLFSTLALPQGSPCP